MADYKAPLRDMRFVLNEVFEVSRLWAQLPALAEVVDAETAAAILEEAGKVTAGTIAPLNRPGDEEGCQWNAGAVSTPAGFPEAYRTYAEGGWVGVGGDPTYGGMGMPKVISAQVEELVNSANLSFGLYPMLTAGACLALNAHASDELKDKYLPNMYAGIWAGSMCLTEPHAGTDLGIIRTRAEPQADGSYKISGTKIFITGGEHDLTENIIHLVLAKLPDAPAGPKGISLFLVPKVLVNADGSLGEKNSLGCGSIEHKMGIKASATCVMNFDGATGWLVGEVNKGLAAMFTMMNYERLGVGIQGLATGERSYQSAIEYARERIQSRAPTGPVAKDKAADPIIVHPDVRRMLLTMKALNEGGRAFSSYVAMQLDTAKYSEDAVTRKRAEELVALLTPVAKAFLTDMGLETTIHGQQIFGGHGFIREWGPGATGARLSHHADLRRHQWHSGARPGGAQGDRQRRRLLPSLHRRDQGLRRFRRRGPGRVQQAAGGRRGEPGRADRLAARPRQGQSQRDRRGVGRIPACVRLHRLCLHVGIDGAHRAGQAGRGRLLRQQAGYRALLLRPPAAAHPFPERLRARRQRVAVPAGRRAVLRPGA
ncbi:acyl-CoA dehydrogenase [Pseudomonas aeruginosa]|nr:acyl-CoA dehydrogenase [Pseudomonas aeruginosa]